MGKWRKNLAKACGKEEIVRLDRAPEIRDVMEGYVVGLSDRFVLLHVLDPNYIGLNGYSVLRLQDIHRYCVRSDHEFFLRCALQLKGIHPVPQPEIDLSDLSALLTSANRHYPLITIHTEKKHPDACYIGQVEELTDTTLLLREIDPAAKWSRTRRYRLKDMTRIEFGGGYEAALMLVAEHEAVRAPADVGQ